MLMLVTRLEYIDKKKVKVYLDGEYHFLLYKTELNREQIWEGAELSTSAYENILEHTVLKRAKQKALSLLKHMDRTEAELRRKLKQSCFTDEIIEKTILYIQSFHYIDDVRYATAYVETRKNKKSRKQIFMELCRKGIAQETARQVLEGFGAEDEAVLRELHKKTEDINALSYMEKQKLAASLYRKGFEAEIIKKYCLSDPD